VEYRDAVVAAGRGVRAYQYSQFCDLYADFRAKVEVSMRQVHRAGEKAFLDYSGKKPTVIDGATGEVTEVELFVMVLGASNYTYAEATRTQRTADFVGSTVRGLEYFGGVPMILVPDQLRSAVTGPDRYDPEINATYAEMVSVVTSLDGELFKKVDGPCEDRGRPGQRRACQKGSSASGVSSAWATAWR
jgi:transposase